MLSTFFGPNEENGLQIILNYDFFFKCRNAVFSEGQGIEYTVCTEYKMIMSMENPHKT